MTGTPSQIEWAEQIKPRVNAEFERVVKAFEQAAGKQSEQDRMDTHAVITILQEKRVEVMAKDQAGYFIRDWQELRDQVHLSRRKFGRAPWTGVGTQRLRSAITGLRAWIIPSFAWEDRT